MSEKPRQIIALGGGGFSMEPENLALDEYVLKQAGVPQPAVAFIPTASGDAEPYIVGFYRAFSVLPCRPSYLPLFSRTPDLREYLLAQDVIYVGGGNTKSLLGVWREWGLPEVLREAWESGVVLAGVSAGAACWFDSFLSDAWADQLSVIRGLGLLSGSCCPHFEFESERHVALHQRLLGGEIGGGYAIANSAALHFRGQHLHRAVASVPGKRSFRFSVAGGRVTEEELPMELLER